MNYSKARTAGRPRLRPDACGAGFPARPSAPPCHAAVETALATVAHLSPRRALDAGAKPGDRAGTPALPAHPIAAS